MERKGEREQRGDEERRDETRRGHVRGLGKKGEKR